MNLKQCPSKKDKRHKIKVKIKLKVKNISFLGGVDENIERWIHLQHRSGELNKICSFRNSATIQYICNTGEEKSAK